MLPVLLIATWLGVIGLNADMIWYDEYWSIWSAGGAHYGPIPLGEIWERAISDPSQPPTYYFLLAGWGSLVGWTPLAIRYSSLLMGVLTVAWTYRLGRDVFPNAGAPVAVLGALLLGTSAFFATYLHELRLYAMMVIFSTMTLALYWRIHTQQKPSLWLQIGFVLSIAGAFYAHYFTMLTVSSVGLYHLLMVRKDRRWWRTTLLMVAGGVLFLPWVGYLLGAIGSFASSGGRTDTAAGTGEVLTLFIYALSNGTFILAGLLVMAVPLKRLNITDTPFKSLPFLWFMAGAIFAQALVLNVLVSVLTHTRYVLSLWPLLSLLLAWGLFQIGGRWRGVAIGTLIIWVGFGVYNSYTTGFSDRLFREVHTAFFRPNLPLDDLGDLIHEQAVSGDVVALHAPNSYWAISGSFDLALHGTPARYRVLDQLVDNVEADEALTRLEDFVSDAGRVWLAVEQNASSNVYNETLADFEALIADYVHCGRVLEYPDLRADLYAQSQIFCETDTSTPVATLNNAVSLSAVDDLTVSEGNLTIQTTWHTEDDFPAQNYSVGMYIFDENGEFVLQGTDYGLPGGKFAYNTAFIPVDTLEAGAYTIELAVYNWQTGERLLTQDGANIVPLGDFIVD